MYSCFAVGVFGLLVWLRCFVFGLLVWLSCFATPEGTYLGCQVVDQRYDGVLEVGASCDWSLGGLCNVLGTLRPHQLQDILLTTTNQNNHWKTVISKQPIRYSHSKQPLKNSHLKTTNQKQSLIKLISNSCLKTTN